MRNIMYKRTLTKTHRKIPRLLIALIIFISVFSQLACFNREAVDGLASKGIETGETLTDFYDTLSKNTNDSWELEIYWTSVVQKQFQGASVGFDEEDIQLLEKRISALESRKEVSKQMTEMYTALKDLNSYDSGARVEAAATKLSKSLGGLLPFPGGIDPSAIVGKVAGDLASWAQEKDVKKKVKISNEAITRISELFDKEAIAYTAIAKENSADLTVVATHLINNEMILPWPLMDRVPAAFGVKWASTASSPPKDKATKDGFIEIIRHRNNRLTKQANEATDNLGTALRNLVAAQNKFLNKKPLDLESVSLFLDRAQSYIDEIKRLKDDYQRSKEDK